jgi:ornithine cyclodeaminase/alanine dehydrogenase-like protein (mu-crystallin family)
MTIRVLSGSDIRSALPMREAIEAMRGAFRQLSEGQAIVPLRVNMPVADDGSCVLVMPVHLQQEGHVGLKLVSIMRSNPSRNLPLIQGMMMVMDGTNGQPRALLNAEELTALRTGAASGLATDVLAPAGSRTVAVFGAGTQGRSQLEGVCTVRAIDAAFAIDPHHERRNIFCRKMSERLGVHVQPAERLSDIPRVDIICTATTSRTPVFADAEVRTGVHINGVGSYSREMREIPPETVVRSMIVVDSRASALAEAGDIVMPIQEGLMNERDIYAELGEIVSGRMEGRTDRAQITFFKSVGNAVQDLAAASRILLNAERDGLGTTVQL